MLELDASSTPAKTFVFVDFTTTSQTKVVEFSSGTYDLTETELIKYAFKIATTTDNNELVAWYGRKITLASTYINAADTTIDITKIYGIKFT